MTFTEFSGLQKVVFTTSNWASFNFKRARTPKEPKTMNKTFVNTALAVLLGGLAVEFMVNKTPVGDLVRK